MSDKVKGLLACGLTWILPGTGHLYLGRIRRGLFFFAIVAAMTVLGLASRGNLSVVMEHAPVLSRLQVGVNLALGPVEPVVRKAVYGRLVYDRRDRGEDVERFFEVRNGRASEPSSPYGTAYLWTAGLLNLLLMLDVFDIATGRKR